MTTHPLIATLQFDKESQHYFNGLRQHYFPKAINYLDAHLTLFHHLPPSQPRILNEIENAVRIGPFAVNVTGVYHTGFGVAFQLQSKPLVQLHQYLHEAFYSWLTPQDRQPFRPHITIQNKVSAEESKQLTAELQQTFKPFTAIGTGINLWEYHNGPWKHQEFFGFQHHHAVGL
ncbi:MAG: 2'-5' RNA ligase family protein [Chitinophagaceae bacterium]|nr:MAG: 2'-5' RNA ligase family protein [Chitinophagaceae bacterium]